MRNGAPSTVWHVAVIRKWWLLVCESTCLRSLLVGVQSCKLRSPRGQAARTSDMAGCRPETAGPEGTVGTWRPKARLRPLLSASSLPWGGNVGPALPVSNFSREAGKPNLCLTSFRFKHCLRLVMTCCAGQTEHIWALYLVHRMLLSNLWCKYCCLILSSLGDRELTTSLGRLSPRLWVSDDDTECL